MRGSCATCGHGSPSTENHYLMPFGGRTPAIINGTCFARSFPSSLDKTQRTWLPCTVMRHMPDSPCGPDAKLWKPRQEALT